MAQRTTEIDSADDILFSEEEEEEAAAPEESEKDSVPLVDEPPPKEEIPLTEEPEPAEAAPAAEAAAASEEDEDDEAGEKKKKEPKTTPSALFYYGIPAIGAFMILGLGWTFAFIARTALVSDKAASKVVQQPLQPKVAVAPPKTPPVPVKPPKDMLKALVPGAPSVKEILASRGVLMKPSAGGLIVDFGDPFFIPLEGARNGRGARKENVFLHLSISLSVSNKAALREAKGKRSQIRAAVFEHFNRLAPADVQTFRGREKSRKVLLARVSKEIIQGKVNAIFYNEFFTR